MYTSGVIRVHGCSCTRYVDKLDRVYKPVAVSFVVKCFRNKIETWILWLIKINCHEIKEDKRKRIEYNVPTMYKNE